MSVMADTIDIDLIERCFSYDEFSPEFTNEQSRARMKKALAKAIREELSERQKEILLVYFSKEMNMIQIAQYYNVNRSTISRTIARALKKLRKAACYCNL